MRRRWLSGSSNQWGDQGSTRRTEWQRLTKKTPRWHLYLLINSKEPTSVKSSRCQYTAKQKQRALLYAGAQKYYSALMHVLGALLVEAPLGHWMFSAGMLHQQFALCAWLTFPVLYSQLAKLFIKMHLCLSMDAACCHLHHITTLHRLGCLYVWGKQHAVVAVTA